MKNTMSCLVATGLVLFASCGNGVLAGEPAGTTVNGDVNCSGQLDLADAIFSLNYLFLGGEEPCPFLEPPAGGPELAALEAELAECNEALVSREAELAARDDEIAALRAELTQAQVDLSGALRDLISTQRDLLAAEARILDLEAAEGPCAEQIEELRSSLETCTSDLAASGEEVEQAQQLAEEAQQEALDAQADSEALALELDECQNPRVEFTALALEESEDSPVSVVTGKVDLLSRITPTAPEAVLAQQETATIELGGFSTETDGEERLLIYDSISRALCSVSLCEGDDCEEADRVRMHYDAAGLSEELAASGIAEPFPALSDTVPVARVRVSRGPGQQRDDWTVAYEPRSRSVVAFRPLDGYRPVRDVTWPDDENFGRGNGLVMSVVISGAEIRSQLGLNSPPPITRIVDAGSGQILLFFDEAVLGDVHLLEIEAFANAVNPDLADIVDRPVWQLGGNFLLFGADDGAYLEASDIRDLTGADSVDIDGFQPFVNPSDGSALVYEGASGQFLKIFTMGFEEAEAVGGSEGQGGVVVEISAESLAEATGDIDGQAEFSQSGGRGNDGEIILIEESSNTILAYNYSGAPDEPGLIPLFASETLAGERIDPAVGCDPDPADEPAGPEGEGEEGGKEGGEVVDLADPVLQMSLEDTLGSRLVFDRGRGELVSLNYSTGRVVLVARGEELGAVTGVEAVNLVYIENTPGDAEGSSGRVRAWDRASASLIELDLENIETELCQ